MTWSDTIHDETYALEEMNPAGVGEKLRTFLTGEAEIYRPEWQVKIAGCILFYSVYHRSS